MLTAFRQELAEAGNASSAQLTRFHLHLDDVALASFIEDLLDLIEEYREEDQARLDQGAPVYGGIVAIHRLVETLPDQSRRSPRRR